MHLVRRNDNQNFNMLTNCDTDAPANLVARSGPSSGKRSTTTFVTKQKKSKSVMSGREGADSEEEDELLVPGSAVTVMDVEDKQQHSGHGG